MNQTILTHKQANKCTVSAGKVNKSPLVLLGPVCTILHENTA